MNLFWALIALAFVGLFIWVETRRSGRFWGVDNPRKRRLADRYRNPRDPEL